MKISVFGIPDMKLGKSNVKDPRLDEMDNFVKAKKRTYVQVDLAGEDALLEADAILLALDSRTDLILRDLEFVETRLGRASEDKEKQFLNKLKGILEKDEFISSASLTKEEKDSLTKYSLITSRPVIAIEKDELSDMNVVLLKALKEGGYISFFTAGEKETRAWLIKNGATAWEAAGAIHSDIQKGFIRAEIIAFDDFISSGGETAAKQAGKLRLEQKDYIMKDTDLANFRFNK